MGRSFWTAFAAFLLPSFPLAYIWHLEAFRVGKEQEAEALSRPGARPMDITGKPMAGFVWVDAKHAADKNLLSWIDLATGYVGSLPPK